MRHALVPVCLAAALAASGCRSALPPTLEVRSARASTEGGVSVVTLEIRASNPNRDAIPLDTIRYELSINGSKVFVGERMPRLSLPGFGERTFLLPAACTGEVAAGTPFHASGELVYVPPGSWRQTLRETGLGRPSVPFEGTGTVRP